MTMKIQNMKIFPTSQNNSLVPCNKLNFKSDISTDTFQKQEVTNPNPKELLDGINWKKPTTDEMKLVVYAADKMPVLVSAKYLDAYQLPDNDYVLLKLKNADNIEDFKEKKYKFIEERQKMLDSILSKDENAFDKIGVSFADILWTDDDENNLYVCMKKAKGVWITQYDFSRNPDRAFAKMVVEGKSERINALVELGACSYAFFESGVSVTDEPEEPAKLEGYVFPPAIEAEFLKARKNIYKTMKDNNKIRQEDHRIFKERFNTMDFSNLSDTDKLHIRKEFGEKLRFVAGNQEYTVYSHNNIGVFITESHMSDPEKIQQMQINHERRIQQLEEHAKYSEASSSVAKSINSFIDSAGHFIVIYEKSKGYYLPDEDLEDSEDYDEMQEAKTAMLEEFKKAGMDVELFTEKDEKGGKNNDNKQS